MKCSTACGVCSGSGGFICALALLAWFAGPAVGGLVSFLGFKIASTDPRLIPVVVGALALTGWGLRLGMKVHHRLEPLLIYALGSTGIVIGLFTWTPAALLGFGTVLGAVGLSTYRVNRAHHTRAQ